MCGIVGLCGDHDPGWICRMNALVRHRGPDASGEYHDETGRVSLAMQRLSILDLGHGAQPMSNRRCTQARGARAETAWIVFNGEIYNSPALRAALERGGHRFESDHSDTEVLLHLYEDKQEGLLADLNGMFAFVIYDRERRRLFGARDRMGIKPFYYTERPDVFAFASELKAFFALPLVERRFDFASLFHYMSLLYVPGDRSIVEGVRRLPPAHYFLFDLQTRRLRIEPYWDLDATHPEQHSEADWAERIRVALADAVQRHTLSDVPVACSLSGGLDSSSIVALLARNGHARISTYSVGFEGEGEDPWNELPLAREVAARYGTDHHEIVLRPEALLDDLVRMVWYLDEPYAGGLPSWYVFRLMSEDVKVGLTGTGGDEDFGNYGKFRFFESSRVARMLLRAGEGYERASASLRWLWRPLRRAAEGLPERWIGQDRQRRLADALDFDGGTFGRYFFNPFYYLSDSSKRAAVFLIEPNGVPGTSDVLRGIFDASRSSSLRDAVAYTDFHTQLPDEFLHMTDRLSMAHSLEARVPFLDHTFVELVFRIPAGLRTRAGDLKYLFKRAVADLLPPAVLQGGKSGFVMPITLWLRGPLRPLVDRLLSEDRLRRQGIFKPAFNRRFVRPHLAGHADHTWQIWAALMFQLWHQVFIDGPADGAPTWSWRDLT